jgi:hypothetical protein
VGASASHITLPKAQNQADANWSETQTYQAREWWGVDMTKVTKLELADLPPLAQRIGVNQP